MISFVPFRPVHLELVRLQPAQEAWRKELVRPGFAEALAIRGMAWTGLVDGMPVGCAGLSPLWDGNVKAWALFGTNIPRRAWTAIVRKIEHEFAATLASHGKHRIEATTPVYFAEGCRLLRILAFNVEGEMQFYGPDGANHFLFGRIVGPCAQ